MKPLLNIGSCRYAKLSAASWIIVSSASHHIKNIRTLPCSFLITLPNEYKVQVIETGDVCLNPALTICNVLFIPRLFNLIFVHCLTQNLKEESVLTPSLVHCRALL